MALKPLPLIQIEQFVDSFVNFARSHQELVFLVTRIGCGYAGYHDVDIAPMFRGCRELTNVVLPKEWA